MIQHFRLSCQLDATMHSLYFSPDTMARKWCRFISVYFYILNQTHIPYNKTGQNASLNILFVFFCRNRSHYIIIKIMNWNILSTDDSFSFRFYSSTRDDIKVWQIYFYFYCNSRAEFRRKFPFHVLYFKTPKYLMWYF